MSIRTPQHVPVRVKGWGEDWSKLEDGLELTAVDDRDLVGWLASATRWWEVSMHDTHSMVEGILERAGRRPIRRLNIIDHGNPHGFQLGDDWITANNLSQYADILERLRGRFTSDGFVHLQHCQAGQNQELLCQLASILGTAVYAGRGLHNPVLRFNLADYVLAHPDGRFQSCHRRP